jgi:Tfp pilus assembly protein PilF
MPADVDPRKQHGWLALALAALALAVYLPVRQAGFLTYDDQHYVRENPHVSSGLTAANAAWAFTAFSAGNWHPLTWISHMADCQIFGLDPAGHHLVNALLHALNAALLFHVFARLTGAPWRSLFLAALFAVHPLNVESVAWIAERKNVLSTLFWLLTLAAYHRYVLRPGTGRYLAVAGAFALGLLSKPMVVTLPLVLLLLDFWPLGRLDPRARDAPRVARRLVLEKVPLLALAAASALLTVLAQRAGGAITSLQDIPFGLRVANALTAYVRYLGKAAWPAELSAFYPHPGAALPLWKPALAGLVLVAVSAAVVRAAPARGYLPVGWFWYLGTLVPVIGLVQVGSQAMADRYAYVPLIGVFLVAVWGLGDLLARRPRELALAGACAVAALAAAARHQVARWHDSRALFEHALRVTEGNDVAHLNLGIVEAQERRWDRAGAHFQEALRVRPDSVEALTQMGVALAQQGRTEEAVGRLQAALALNPGWADAHANLGVALLRQGRTEEAIRHLRQAVALAPEAPEAQANLAAALARNGDREEAMRSLAAAGRLAPGSAAVRSRMGSVLLAEGRLDDAASHFEAALALDPGRADALNGLGVLLMRKGDLPGAVVRYTAALAADPRQADAHANLGEALLRQGKLEEARAHLERALEADGRHAAANVTLGVLKARAGRMEEAVAHFTRALEGDPRHPEALNNLGAALLQLGRTDEAVSRLAQAAAVRPGSADARSNLGVALLQAGQRARAVEELEAALRIDPRHANARKYLELARTP